MLVIEVSDNYILLPQGLSMYGSSVVKRYPPLDPSSPTAFSNISMLHKII